VAKVRPPCLCTYACLGGRWLTLSLRTLELGPFAGPIYVAILAVECLFFLLLEWTMPREDIDYVSVDWEPAAFEEVRKP
jgi:hypothetical protein